MKGEEQEAKDLPPKLSIFASFWRLSSNLKAQFGWPAEDSKRGQTVSDAREDDQGTTTSQHKECHVGYNSIPNSYSTAGPDCWYITPAHSNTWDPQKEHTSLWDCSVRITCLLLVLVCKCNYPKYICKCLYIFAHTDTWGFFMSLESFSDFSVLALLRACPWGAGSGTSTASGTMWRQAGIVLCTTAFVCSLSLFNEGCQAATSVTQRFSSGSHCSKTYSEKMQP